MSVGESGRSDKPGSLDDLEKAISNAYPRLSPQLKVFASFVLERPEEIALDTIKAIAGRAGVQPSTIVRFAKIIGFHGFSDLQAVLRAELIAGTPNYRARIRSFLRSGETETAAGLPDTLSDFAEEGILDLQMLRDGADRTLIRDAVALLARARGVKILGQRRSFAVCHYLWYALMRLEVPAQLLDDTGSLLQQQAALVSAEEAVIAVSFKPYTPIVIETAGDLHARGVPLVAITDSVVSPLIGKSDVCIHVQESGRAILRSIIPHICLAQTLIVGLGEALEAGPRGADRTAPRRDRGAAGRTGKGDR